MSEPAFNPYAPPAETSATDLVPLRAAHGDEPARPVQRLGGLLVDGLVLVVASVPALVCIGLLLDKSDAVKWAILSSFLLAAGTLQWVLVANDGQSIGKRAARIKIVLLDGSQPGFLRGVVLRSWCGYLPALIPFAGQAYLVIDALLVFRPEGRTLRDVIAGTRVVRQPPRAT